MVSSDNAMGEEEQQPGAFEVECILNDRLQRGQREYYVHWKGYGSSEDEWVPRKNMQCPDLLKEYTAQKRALKKPKRRKSKVNTPASAKSKKKTANVPLTPLQLGSDEDDNEDLTLMSLANKRMGRRNPKRKHSEDDQMDQDLFSTDQMQPIAIDTGDELPCEACDILDTFIEGDPLAEENKLSDLEKEAELDDDNKHSCSNVEVIVDHDENQITVDGDTDIVETNTINEDEQAPIVAAEANILPYVEDVFEQPISDEATDSSSNVQILADILRQIMPSNNEEEKGKLLTTHEIIGRAHLVYLKQLEIRNTANRVSAIEEKDHYKLGHRAEVILLLLNGQAQNGQTKEYALVKFENVLQAQLVALEYVKQMDPKLVEEYLQANTNETQVDDSVS